MGTLSILFLVIILSNHMTDNLYIHSLYNIYYIRYVYTNYQSEFLIDFQQIYYFFNVNSINLLTKQIRIGSWYP